MAVVGKKRRKMGKRRKQQTMAVVGKKCRKTGKRRKQQTMVVVGKQRKTYWMSLYTYRLMYILHKLTPIKTISVTHNQLSVIICHEELTACPNGLERT